MAPRLAFGSRMTAAHRSRPLTPRSRQNFRSPFGPAHTRSDLIPVHLPSPTPEKIPPHLLHSHHYPTVPRWEAAQPILDVGKSGRIPCCSHSRYTAASAGQEPTARPDPDERQNTVVPGRHRICLCGSHNQHRAETTFAYCQRTMYSPPLVHPKDCAK